MWLGKPQTNSSWLPETSLPINIVQEYERGVHQEISVDLFASGGQTISTLSRCDPAKNGDLRNDKTKRQRLDKSLLESTNSG